MEIALFCNFFMGMTSHQCAEVVIFRSKSLVYTQRQGIRQDHAYPWRGALGAMSGVPPARGQEPMPWPELHWLWNPLALSSHELLRGAEQRKEPGCWRWAVRLSNWLYPFMHGSIVFSSQGLCLFTCRSRMLDRDSMMISLFPVPILNGWPWISGASYWERFHWCVGASSHVSNWLCI